MTKEAIIEKTVRSLSKLSKDKIKSVSNYISFLILKEEEMKLEEGINILNEESGAFDFLYDEPDLYTVEDLIEFRE